MKIVLALAVGYVVGAKTGGKDLDQLGGSLKALCETDEFADVVAAPGPSSAPPCANWPPSSTAAGA